MTCVETWSTKLRTTCSCRKNACTCKVLARDRASPFAAEKCSSQVSCCSYVYLIVDAGTCPSFSTAPTCISFFSGRMVQRRRHLERRAVRAAQQRVAHGVSDVEAALRSWRGSPQQPPVRSGWSRRPVVPEQHREVAFSSR